jgi:hypothetical protein
MNVVGNFIRFYQSCNENLENTIMNYSTDVFLVFYFVGLLNKGDPINVIGAHLIRACL